MPNRYTLKLHLTKGHLCLDLLGTSRTHSALQEGRRTHSALPEGHPVPRRSLLSLGLPSTAVLIEMQAC